MGADLQKQFHRLGLFVGIWGVAILPGYFWAWYWGDGPESGFGKLMESVADRQALWISILVPLFGTVLAFVIWVVRRKKKDGITTEAWRDMEEFGNDTVAVIYNALSLAGAALFVCALRDLNNEGTRWFLFGAAAWGIAALLAFAYSRLPEAWRKRHSGH